MHFCVQFYLFMHGGKSKEKVLVSGISAIMHKRLYTHNFIKGDRLGFRLEFFYYF